MKKLFAIALAVLVCGVLFTWWLDRNSTTTETELFWATDLSPAKQLQAKLFTSWLENQGEEKARLSIDAANADFSKKLIQGISGVLGDIVDCYDGKAEMQFLQEAGMLMDVTEAAEKMGFAPDKTYPAIAQELLVDGKQYGFPANVFTQLLWVNTKAFQRVEQSPPPKRWTLDEFETLGRAYVKAANPAGVPQKYFFTDPIHAMHRQIFRRSLGTSFFNETLTGSRLADPRNIDLLERIYHWTYVDRICPSLSDASAFNAQGGFWGSNAQLFHDGNFALYLLGRYALIPLRELGTMDLQVVEPPHGGFPNTLVGARVSAVYRQARHPELALQFLKFLASPEYNAEIVRSADALPPVPEYADGETFCNPPDHPGEAGTHEMFLAAAETIGIVNETSPFVLPRLASRIELNAYDAFMASRLDAMSAMEDADRRIQQEIELYLAENPGVQAEFEKRQELQKSIDARLHEGKKIPANWIFNPFHQKYYESHGLLEKAQ